MWVWVGLREPDMKCVCLCVCGEGGLVLEREGLVPTPHRVCVCVCGGVSTVYNLGMGFVINYW